jgi:glucose-1-phosphate adenylyltransferase
LTTVGRGSVYRVPVVPGKETVVRTLVLILAGGAGGRLSPLTDDRAKPAVPFAGLWRLIDFPLSNCAHAGLPDVWVVQQFHPASLSDHLANGRPWDLDRTYGGLLVLHPHLGDERGGFHSGTADALWRNSGLLADFGADALVVVSADAVYRLDYARVVDEHIAAGADLTMVTTRVAAEDAGRYGVVQVDGSGRVTDYVYKPDRPAGDLVSNEVFVFTGPVVLDAVERLGRDADQEQGLGDLGEALLPVLVDAGRVREHRLAGYWRDVGTVEAYWSAHMDQLADPPPLRLDDPAWPVLTVPTLRRPARVDDGARVADSLLSPGVRVAGRVQRSVLGPGVVVEAGATVADSVLLGDVRVGRGATVSRAVLDERCVVEPEVSVGGGDELAVCGRGSRLGGGG